MKSFQKTAFYLMAIVAVILLMTASCQKNNEPDDQLITPKLLTEHIEVRGIEREYIIYIPANYNGSKPVPLLFNFHGYSMTASVEIAYADFRAIADTAGFIIVCPQGSLLNGETHWNVGSWTIGSTSDDLGFVRATIDRISTNYNIDNKRIYSTGFSNGGFFSLKLACQMSDKFAAIASVGGSMTPDTYTNCKAQHPMPVLFIHGTSDGTVPYEGLLWSEPLPTAIGYWVNSNNCNPKASIASLPDLDPSDGSTVEHHIYGQGDSNITVELYKIINGNHSWPGTSDTKSDANRDINASAKVWKFLSQYNIYGKL